MGVIDHMDMDSEYPIIQLLVCIHLMVPPLASVVAGFHGVVAVAGVLVAGAGFVDGNIKKWLHGGHRWNPAPLSFLKTLS